MSNFDRGISTKLTQKANVTFKKDRCLNRIASTCDTFIYQVRDIVTKTIIIDAMALSSHPELYLEANLFQYTVAIVCWILITRDVFGDLVLEAELKDALKSHGLAKVVDVVKSCVAPTLRGDAEFTLPWTWLAYPVSALHQSPSRGILTWFRFLARFTPSKADRFVREAEIAFFNLNDSISIDDYKHKGWYLLDNLGRGVISEITSFRFDPSEFAWSNGVCNDGCTVAEKLSSFSKFSPYLYSPLYPLAGGQRHYGLWNFVTPLCVPKNLKTPRIIAPVSSYKGALSHQLRKHLTAELQRLTGIDLATAQSVNREYAQKASTDGLAATVDESSASDSIAWQIYKRIFPATVVNAMNYVREHVFFNKYRWGRVKMAFASGNPTTFVAETWFFYSVCELAMDYYNLFTGCNLSKDDIKVYGDDIIVPVEIYETVVDLLSNFGIRVNTDKSYATGSFRESCGGEYINGESVESYYWPRREVVSESPSKAAFLLCSLHNKLFTYRNTRSFLKTIIQRLMPKMTVQRGFEYDDLHDDCSPLTTRLAPVGKIEHHSTTLQYKEFVTDALPKGVKKEWLSAVPKHITYRICDKVIPSYTTVTTAYRDVFGDVEPSEDLLREVHTILTTTYKEYSHNDNIEMLLYVSFLKDGPYFETPLDELLGVSSPRLDRRTLTNIGDEVIKTVVR